MNINIDGEYIHRTDTGVTLIKPVVVTVRGQFNEDMSKAFFEDMDKALLTGQRVIPIRIDSFGGYVHTLIGMIDYLEELKSRRYHIVTMVIGKAMSCGALLFMMGDERYIAPMSEVMIHRMWSMTAGRTDDMKADLEATQRLEARVKEACSINIGKGKSWLIDELAKRKDTDWTLTARECKRHNVATRIGLPVMNLNIKTTFEVSP